MATAPEIFDQDDDGLAFVIEDRPVPDDAALIDRAQFLCPARAIHKAASAE